MMTPEAGGDADADKGDMDADKGDTYEQAVVKWRGRDSGGIGPNTYSTSSRLTRHSSLFGGRPHS